MIKKIIGFTMDCLETVTFIGSIYIVIYLFLFMPTQVRGASMEPTLHDGDRLIINKLAYKLRNPERGDIVIIVAPTNQEQDYVKRIIGLPGDTILIDQGEVYINGNNLPDTFISAKTNVWVDGMIKEGETFTVPQDDIFVMGDNRPNSSDSRMFGPVPISSIVGQVSLRYTPTDQFSLFPNPLPKDLQ
jgi:signal peptidase I